MSSESENAAHSQSNIRILVVDDEPSILKIVSTILTRAQYQVTTCENADEVLNLLKRESFDCIITDAAMPSKDGYQLVKEIRTVQFDTIPIIMLTRKRERQDVKKAVDAGITDYVLKPIDEHLLLDKVEICLKKGSGKRHVLECAVHGAFSKAELSFPCTIATFSESFLTLRLPMSLPFESQFEINAPLFNELGINPPLIKLISCKEVSNPLESRDHAYEAKFSFIGVLEADLRKIRTWLNREEIRRRK